jgi:hypothetical protein
MARRFDASLNGISFNEFIIMYTISQARDGKMRRVELAESMGLTPSGITRLLLPMEKIGLIYLMTHVYPDQVAHVLWPQSYLPLLLLFFGASFFGLSYLFLHSRRGFHWSLALTALLPGGSSIVEFTVDVPGKYLLVDHALARMNKGAWAVLDVTGDQQPALYQQIEFPPSKHSH